MSITLEACLARNWASPDSSSMWWRNLIISFIMSCRPWISTLDTFIISCRPWISTLDTFIPLMGHVLITAPTRLPSPSTAFRHNPLVRLSWTQFAYLVSPSRLDGIDLNLSWMATLSGSLA
uniref:Uncharacterized protein n=1 Tax=Cacopsylla melanoneura TaxID=428564 RepID=A0A8D8Y1W0_9HEMI